jgi:hypothetical protein
MKEVVEFNGKHHLQFNSIYVCTQKVAGDRHGLTEQLQNTGIAGLGFLVSQNSVGSMECGGGGGNRSSAERQRRVEESDNLEEEEEEEEEEDVVPGHWDLDI